MRRFAFGIFVGIGLPILTFAVKVGTGSPPTPSTMVDIPTLVSNVYNFAFLIGGLLAFGAVVYGAARYTFSAGNPGGQSDARDQITQAMLGLLLLLGAYVVLNTINPNLVSFQLPTLEKIQGAVEGGASPGGLVPCGTNGEPCQDSPSVQALLSNLPAPYNSVQATTYQGSHHPNSCHFGGRSCTDGSHAIDWGKNAMGSIKLVNMLQAAQTSAGQVGVQASCRCEDEGGNNILSCSDPSANHVHCNVNIATCGCN